jgi:hypothetical protein
MTFRNKGCHICRKAASSTAGVCLSAERRPQAIRLPRQGRTRRRWNRYTVEPHDPHDECSPHYCYLQIPERQVHGQLVHCMPAGHQEQHLVLHVLPLLLPPGLWSQCDTSAGVDMVTAQGVIVGSGRRRCCALWEDGRSNLETSTLTSE